MKKIFYVLGLFLSLSVIDSPDLLAGKDDKNTPQKRERSNDSLVPKKTKITKYEKKVLNKQEKNYPEEITWEDLISDKSIARYPGQLTYLKNEFTHENKMLFLEVFKKFYDKNISFHKNCIKLNSFSKHFQIYHKTKIDEEGKILKLLELGMKKKFLKESLIETINKINKSHSSKKQIEFIEKKINQLVSENIDKNIISGIFGRLFDCERNKISDISEYLKEKELEIDNYLHNMKVLFFDSDEKNNISKAHKVELFSNYAVNKIFLDCFYALNDENKEFVRSLSLERKIYIREMLRLSFGKSQVKSLDLIERKIGKINDFFKMMCIFDKKFPYFYLFQCSIPFHLHEKDYYYSGSEHHYLNSFYFYDLSYFKMKDEDIEYFLQDVIPLFKRKLCDHWEKAIVLCSRLDIKDIKLFVEFISNEEEITEQWRINFLKIFDFIFFGKKHKIGNKYFSQCKIEDWESDQVTQRISYNIIYPFLKNDDNSGRFMDKFQRASCLVSDFCSFLCDSEALRSRCEISNNYKNYAKEACDHFSSLFLQFSEKDININNNKHHLIFDKLRSEIFNNNIKFNSIPKLINEVLLKFDDFYRKKRINLNRIITS